MSGMVKTEFKCWTRPTNLKKFHFLLRPFARLLGVQWGSASLPDSEADAEQAIFCWLLSHCKSCPSGISSHPLLPPSLVNPPLPILLPGWPGTYFLQSNWRLPRFSELLLTFPSEWEDLARMRSSLPGRIESWGYSDYWSSTITPELVHGQSLWIWSSMILQMYKMSK